MSGQFFWYDVMSTDTTAAATFYSAVVGWAAEEVAGMDYTRLSVDGQGVAGLMPLPADVERQGGRPAWLGYVAVDDVDQAAGRLKEAGGTVHREPETIPGIIRFAVVSDPHGAVFYLAKGLSSEAPAEPSPGTPGTIGWRELFAGDGSAAFDFYREMFGWAKGETFDMGPMGPYQLFTIGGVPVGGIMTKPEAVPRPNWLFYFNVPEIRAASERVKTAGGVVMMGPTEVPGGLWIVQCRDLQGAVFGLLAAR